MNFLYPLPVEEDPVPMSYVEVGKGRFVRLLERTIGFGSHRSGWSECVRALSHVKLPMVIDDFVEQTFSLHRGRTFHHQPFAAFFHLPPDDAMPAFVAKKDPVRHEVLLASRAWKAGEANLRAAFTLSEELAAWLRPRLKAPVFSVKYASEVPELKWSPERFLAQPQLAQVGFFFKDTRAIHRLKIGMKRVRILNLNNPWVANWDHIIGEFTRTPLDSGVLALERLDNDAYDTLLASSIVVASYLAVSASTVVVECIARNTPLLVNRLPAIEEYLGKDYPLYQDQVRDLDRDLIPAAIDAHQYLREMNKSWISYGTFVTTVKNCLESLEP